MRGLTPYKSGAWKIYLLSLAALVLLLFMNLVFGSVPITLSELWTVLSGREGGSPSTFMIIHQFRIPQSITAVFAGAGLAVAGLMMQTLFKNPLADPSILGISSGASLGVALLLMATGQISGHALIHFGWARHIGVIASAALGSLLVLTLITMLSKRLSGMTSLLIAGIMIAYFTSAIVGIIKYFSQKEDLQAFVIWGMGSFSNVGQQQLLFFSLVTGMLLAVSFLFIKPLNLLLLGDRYAENLGLNTKLYQRWILVIAGLLTAAVTAYAGPIAFIGLAVPHLARNMTKSADHRILLPSSVIMGASLALFCNLIARLPGFDGSLPINSITSLIGAPFVIAIIWKRQRFYSETK